jgi:hypothetical protein
LNTHTYITKQNKTKQNKTKQNKTKQNKTKQNKIHNLSTSIFLHRLPSIYNMTTQTPLEIAKMNLDIKWQRFEFNTKRGAARILPRLEQAAYKDELLKSLNADIVASRIEIHHIWQRDNLNRKRGAARVICHPKHSYKSLLEKRKQIRTSIY